MVMVYTHTVLELLMKESLVTMLNRGKRNDLAVMLKLYITSSIRYGRLRVPGGAFYQGQWSNDQVSTIVTHIM